MSRTTNSATPNHGCFLSSVGVSRQWGFSPRQPGSASELARRLKLKPTPPTHKIPTLTEPRQFRLHRGATTPNHLSIEGLNQPAKLPAIPIDVKPVSAASYRASLIHQTSPILQKRANYRPDGTLQRLDASMHASRQSLNSRSQQRPLSLGQLRHYRQTGAAHIAPAPAWPGPMRRSNRL